MTSFKAHDSDASFDVDVETSNALSSSSLDHRPSHSKADETIRATLQSVGRFFRVYFHSVALGARIVFTHRKFAWLLTGYTLPLVLHRFIENVLFPTFARNILKNGAYSGILVGGGSRSESSSDDALRYWCTPCVLTYCVIAGRFQLW